MARDAIGECAGARCAPGMLPSEFDLSGKVVLNTAAGRGIGSGIAEVLAEAGANAALNALTPTYADQTAAAINDRLPAAAGGSGRVKVFTGCGSRTDHSRRN